MSEIKFKPSHGYPDGSPFYMVMVAAKPGARVAIQMGQGFAEVWGPHPTLDAALEVAAAKAAEHFGQDVFVLSPIRVVRTSRDLVGEHFEPSRAPRERVIEDAPVQPMPVSE